MKHILLFENFDDHLDPSTRDIFGLEDRFSITFIDHTYHGDQKLEYCMIKGPSENFDKAEEIVDAIKEEVDDLEEKWRDEGRYIDETDIDDLFYVNNYREKLKEIGYSIYYWHGPKTGYVKSE
jgi:hypothetical protein